VFKHILVPATGAETDAPVFATASAVARLFRAHLEFLHVRIDVRKTLAAMATADIGGGAGYDEILPSLEQEVLSRQNKAEFAFRQFCRREGLVVSDNPAAGLPRWNGG
jgi:nucleotide-binding universal stress UspA family protein